MNYKEVSLLAEKLHTVSRLKLVCEKMLSTMREHSDEKITIEKQCVYVIHITQSLSELTYFDVKTACEKVNRALEDNSLYVESSLIVDEVENYEVAFREIEVADDNDDDYDTYPETLIEFYAEVVNRQVYSEEELSTQESRLEEYNVQIETLEKQLKEAVK